MAKRAPKLIAINHDDYHARHVGRAADGRQFFLTNPFVSAMDGHPGREFLALYLFDKEGALVEAQIEDLGTRAELDEAAAGARRDALLVSLGEVRFRRIKVAPFRVERFGVAFGLIPQPPEDPEDDWGVIAEPGNYMAFFPPWSSGEYDT